MDFVVNIFPNYEDDQFVKFNVHVQLYGEEEPEINHFEVKIEGNIPANTDSVSELRQKARERAKTILALMSESF